ncbi:MAG: carboxypeptidase-like regulatory domain-containing protein, partial [Chitinophagaceae bacterium]
MSGVPHRFYARAINTCGVFFFMLLRICMIVICMNMQLSLAQPGNYIRGTVWNAETETAIPNASVFITNTSRGTVSAADGGFSLTGIPAGKFDLVISSVGFATQVYSFSSEKLPLLLKIYLQPRVTELDAVVVEPYLKDGWEQWGKFFIDNFLGTTDAAKLCILRNHKALRFRFSKKRNLLTVSADEPLIIDNRDLGYRIQYQLEDFRYDFAAKTFFYLGYTLFEDMAEKKKAVPRRFLIARRKAYAGSMMHFN